MRFSQLYKILSHTQFCQFRPFRFWCPKRVILYNSSVPLFEFIHFLQVSITCDFHHFINVYRIHNFVNFDQFASGVRSMQFCTTRFFTFLISYISFKLRSHAMLTTLPIAISYTTLLISTNSLMGSEACNNSFFTF